MAESSCFLSFIGIFAHWHFFLVCRKINFNDFLDVIISKQGSDRNIHSEIMQVSLKKTNNTQRVNSECKFKINDRKGRLRKGRFPLQSLCPRGRSGL